MTQDTFTLSPEVKQNLQHTFDRFTYSGGCSNTGPFGKPAWDCEECTKIFLKVCMEVVFEGREVKPAPPTIKDPFG